MRLDPHDTLTEKDAVTNVARLCMHVPIQRLAISDCSGRVHSHAVCLQANTWAAGGIAAEHVGSCRNPWLSCLESAVSSECYLELPEKVNNSVYD